MNSSTLLEAFKGKIEEAIMLISALNAEDKLKAVQYWNLVSERLQAILNRSVDDISAYALQVDSEKIPDYIDASQLIAMGITPAFMTRYIPASIPTVATLRPETMIKHISSHLVVSAGVTDHSELIPIKDNHHTAIEVALTNEVEVLDEHQLELSKEVVKQLEHDEMRIQQAIDAAQMDVAMSNIDHELENGVDDMEDETSTVHMMITTESTPATMSGVDSSNGCDVISSEQNTVDLFKCTHCDKSFKTSAQLTSHNWLHLKPYFCKDCNATFSTKGNLIVHMRRHTGEKPFLCPMCPTSFSTRGNLKRHIKSHNGEKPWKCIECGSCFTENKSLKVHMRRHTGERPYQCRMCDQSFSQTGILKTHMAIHLNKKEHKCSECGRFFRQKSQLRLHEQRHAGLRKYNCDMCDSKFLTKADMLRHKRTHTGEKPFVCELCGKNFTRQETLTEHMNRHYGLKPYECKYCQKGYFEMSACYKHTKTHEQVKAIDKNQSPDKQQESTAEPCRDSMHESKELVMLREEDGHKTVGGGVTRLFVKRVRKLAARSNSETDDLSLGHKLSEPITNNDSLHKAIMSEDKGRGFYHDHSESHNSDFTVVNLKELASSFR